MKGMIKIVIIFRVFVIQLLGLISIPLIAQKYNSGGNETLKKDSIKWYSFNEGHSKAISENKILLINVSTESCYFCKLMDKHTYSNSGVIDTLNKYFVCVYLNPEIDRSYSLNDKEIKTKELMKYLFVDEQVAYPTSLFWLHSESEEKRHVISGFMQPPIFLKLLDAARALRSSSKFGFTLKFHEITHHY